MSPIVADDIGNRASGMPGFLFIVPWDLHHSGGVNQVVQNLAFAFQDERDVTPVIMIAGHGSDELKVGENVKGIPLVRLTLKSPSAEERPVRTLLSYIRRLPRTVSTLRRVLRNYRIGAINIHYPSLTAFTVVLAAKYTFPRRKLLLSFHGADIAAIRGASAGWRAIWRLLLAHADAGVFCSHALASEFKTLFPSFEPRMRVIHNGVDCHRAKEAAGAGVVPSPLSGKRVLLNAATLEWKKGQDVLIQAFARIAARFADTILVLMGRPAAAQPELVRLIDRLELNDRVFIFESVPHKDVLATMRAAALFVLPSRKEPFGIVLLEAAVFQLPVIASRTGGIVEIIEHEVSGLLVEPDDIADLARVIGSVLDGAVPAREYATNLHQRAIRCFSWSRAARQYLELIA